MNVDDSGYITIPKNKQLQSAYSDVVNMLVHHLNEVFHSQIHSIYLYGSVANGNAVLGESDLDVTVIFNIPIDPLVTKNLSNIQSVVCSKYIKISKIDFDCASLEEALSPSNNLSWGYWLKHHCICIFGYNLSQDIKRFKPSLELAIAINGDFSDVIHQLEITDRKSVV